MLSSINYILALNGINCYLAAMAKGLGIDLGESLKEYEVSIDKPVYCSNSITEVREVYYKCLKARIRKV